MEFKLIAPTKFLNEITFNKEKPITEIKNRLAKYTKKNKENKEAIKAYDKNENHD